MKVRMKLRESDISQRSASQAKLKEIMLEGLSKFFKDRFSPVRGTRPGNNTCSTIVLRISGGGNGRSDIFEILSWTPKAFCAYFQRCHCRISLRECEMEDLRWR